MNYLMPLYWLCYRHHNQISVVIKPGASLIRHQLDRKWKVAKQMVGRRLSQEEAKRLLAKLNEGGANIPFWSATLRR